MRIVKQITTVLFSAGMFLCMSQPMQAQDDAQRTALQEKLKEQFVLTKVTADNTDIVTAGSIITLHMDGLQMCSIDAKVSMPNSLKNGKFTTSMADRMLWNMMGTKSGTNIHDVPQRKFVAGEKFFLKRYQVDKDGVEFEFYSDPYNDVRYWGQLKISLPKNNFPPPDDVMKTIAEVFTVDSQPEAAPAAQSAPPPAPAAPEPPPPPEPAMAPIAPPSPPPPAAPKTIALGQTKDEVAAILGQPDKVANLGTKEIDYYPDMKVVYTNGKVTDIQ